MMSMKNAVHLDVFIVGKHETVISSRFCSSTTCSFFTYYSLWRHLASLCRYGLVIFPHLTSPLCHVVRGCNDAKLIWRSTHCSSFVGTNLQSQTRTSLIPKLIFHSNSFKVLRKPIPWIHHIKIKHYLIIVYAVEHCTPKLFSKY